MPGGFRNALASTFGPALRDNDEAPIPQVFDLRNADCEVNCAISPKNAPEPAMARGWRLSNFPPSGGAPRGAWIYKVESN
jgi:hypothetical protein